MISTLPVRRKADEGQRRDQVFRCGHRERRAEGASEILPSFRETEIGKKWQAGFCIHTWRH